MSFTDRLFRSLTRLLPAEFRGEYEREMRATFRAEERAARGSWALTRLWLATLADIVRTAPGEHLDILRRDVAYTVRMLGRRPALTVTAVITLALGIGANTAIFSVVDGVLWAPLPYPDPERLVVVQEDEADDDPGTTGYYSFDAARARQGSLESLAAMAGWTAILTGDGADAERVTGARVTWEYFRTLRVVPALGRDFDQADDHPERRRVALLSDGLWRRRYGADPSIVGRQVTINGSPYTIAGVMPPALNELVSSRTFPDAELWSLLGYSTAQPWACRTCRHIHAVGRLKPGVALEQAEADLTRIYQSLAAEFPREYAEPSVVLTPVREHFLGPVRQPLLLLWGAVGLLLLMACANIANLLLIRASEREEEIAIRRALGVSPVRLLRQLLTESVLLAALGGVAGALLAWWGTELLTTNAPDAIPRMQEVAVNGRVLLYAVGVSIATGALFGMAPARMLVIRTGGEPRPAAAAGSPVGARATAGRVAWRYRATLIAVNVALSVLLLVGSGLLLRSFLRLVAVEPGFDPRGVLTLEMTLAGPQYEDVPRVVSFYDELITRLSRLPGVTAASVATQLPLTGNVDRSGISVEGRPLANPAEAPEADRYSVGPAYFAAMNVPLVRGRLLDATDGPAAPRVVVINRAMAERVWPGDDPIGRRIQVGGGPDNPLRTIVGIVGDVRHYGLHLPETLQVYVPHAQMYYPESMVSLVVRAAEGQDPLSLAGPVRAEVRALDPLQPVTKLRSYDAILAESMATRRFTLVLLALFAATALILAVVGLYGALSYVVRQRQREIGVRVALGAASRHIRRLVVGQGMRPALAGLFVGLALSVAAGRTIESLLYGVAPTDAATLGGVLAVVAGCALLACLLPARRAARIDPATTLRAE